MELVAKEATNRTLPTLAEQVDTLLNQQSDLEKIFNQTSNDLFGAGPYDRVGEVGVDPGLSSKLQLMIERNKELISNITALRDGVRGDDK